MIVISPLALLIPGGWEWFVILGVVLLFFGNRIPGMARSLGLGIVEFRKGLKGESTGEQSKLPEGSAEPEEKKQGQPS